jgi:hypothetical protein
VCPRVKKIILADNLNRFRDKAHSFSSVHKSFDKAPSLNSYNTLLT